MPRRKFIDKKTSTTYALVHRAQNDPLIHDEDAPSMVFAEKAQAQPRRPREDNYAYSSAGSVVSSSSNGEGFSLGRTTKEWGDLEDEFGLMVRKNEGEAAQHGVFFDDSEYDYMQHMRDLGSGEGGAVTWVEASTPGQQQKGKGKQKLDDALRSLDLHDDVDGDEGRLDDARSLATTSTTASSVRSLFPEEMFGSEFVKKGSYQDQQAIPDDIAGLQPDMDPALREVLEALDDEAYVLDEDEDFFAELTRDGFEVEKEEWERTAERRLFDDDDDDDENEDGWESESEDTVRASSPPPPPDLDHDPPPALDLADGEIAKPPEDTQAQPPADPTDGAWLAEFKKFKSATKNASSTPQAAAAPVAPMSGLESSALSSLATGRKKKRKGAKTSTTNYSMTSSALTRTDHQTLLDSRFDKMEAAYEADEFPDDEDEPLDDSVSFASGVSHASNASKMSKYSSTSALSKASGVSSYSRASDAGAPQLQRADFEGIMDEFLSGYSTGGKKTGRRGKRGGGIEQLDEVRRGLGPARRVNV